MCWFKNAKNYPNSSVTCLGTKTNTFPPVALSVTPSLLRFVAWCTNCVNKACLLLKVDENTERFERAKTNQFRSIEALYDSVCVSCCWCWSAIRSRLKSQLAATAELPSLLVLCKLTFARMDIHLRDSSSKYQTLISLFVPIKTVSWITMSCCCDLWNTSLGQILAIHPTWERKVDPLL